MVAYKGTRACTLSQCIANKPGKWDLNCSSAPVHLASSWPDLLLYQGASTFFNVALREQEQMLTLASGDNTMQNHNTAMAFCCLLWQLLHQFHLGSESAWLPGCQVHRHQTASVELPWWQINSWWRQGMELVITGLLKGWLQWNGEMVWQHVSTFWAMPEIHLYKTPAKLRWGYIPLFGYILDVQFLADLQEGLWPTQFETSQQVNIKSWPTIIKKDRVTLSTKKSLVITFWPPWHS